MINLYSFPTYYAETALLRISALVGIQTERKATPYSTQMKGSK